ncbi:exodeoxyribonuclease VII small subunit [Aceticella autotrophica]|uniref:Exodeoxyribonuclease 7 small subunit n=1 Tax=Aceticella autotrophica TaxID=2755338 RepID=A0A975AXT4_9THEO|nr:exodeoxyribonuclease VII small subunit [Aceticella autotrophica]QSZ28378.1 exodeoxyribonuclease VII small subunit [Aceticella autotrophica]
MNEELNFEENMDRLEKIVSALEKGNLTLDESFRLFKEGLDVSKKLEEILNDIEGKITILINGKEEIPFDFQEEKDV